jgi:hypothetical protein
MTNQYAAMPSLHCGWALWCGVMLWRHGGTRLTKVVGVAYPLLTAIVVMGTANHYLLDAVAGVVVMGLGFLLAPQVMKAADRLRVRFEGRGSLVAARSRDSSLDASRDASRDASHGSETSIVSGGCQTSPGERIPRQRESQLGTGAEPGASPTDAGDGAPAPAR